MVTAPVDHQFTVGWEPMDTWLDLLNSDWHDHTGSGKREDRLDNPEWLARYRAHLGELPPALSDAELRDALRRLRTLLRAIVDHIVAGTPVPPSAWEALNAIMARSPVVNRIRSDEDGFQLELIPRVHNTDTVISRIAVDFCRTLAEGEAARIKVCRNPDCLWVFYDHSKNRSRQWCEGDTGCGSLMKVRRFRARKKQEKPAKKK